MALTNGGPYGVLRRVLTNAEILALNTTPVVLLEAKPGVVYTPTYMSFYKPAGAYSAVAVGDDLVLEAVDADSNSGIPYATLRGFGVLDQSDEQGVAFSIGSGQISTLGQGLQVRLLGPITTGTVELVLKLAYIEDYPALGA
jgi:hypothetical protein